MPTKRRRKNNEKKKKLHIKRGRRGAPKEKEEATQVTRDGTL